MKKVLKNNLKTIIIAVIASIVTSVTSIFAYSLIAEDVGFTPKDTTWNVQDVDAALNNLNLRYNQLSTHYSTEEQVVGEWIDGKPLYQKTISKVVNLSTSWTTVDTIENLDYATIIAGNVSSYTHMHPFFEFVIDGNSIKVDTTNSGYSGNRLIIITVQYTKTTD